MPKASYPSDVSSLFPNLLCDLAKEMIFLLAFVVIAALAVEQADAWGDGGGWAELYNSEGLATNEV